MKWIKFSISFFFGKRLFLFSFIKVLLLINIEALSQSSNYTEVIAQWTNTLTELQKNKEKLYGVQAPSFSGITFNEDTFDLKDHEGSVIFIYHTSIHCGPCLANTENMNRLAHQFNGKVKFIALTGDTSREIEMYQEKKSYLDFDIIPRMSYVWANTFKMPQAYPIIMILDRELKIRYIKMGANPDAKEYWQFIENEVVPVIEENL